MIRHVVRWAACLAVLALSIVCGLGTAYAAENPVTVVGPFTGPKKETLRQRVEDALLGDGAELGKSEYSPPDGAPPGEFKAAAQRHNIKAFITGHSAMSKGGWTLTLSVFSGKDGKRVGKTVVQAGWLPGLLKAIDKNATTQLADPISKTAAPSAAGAEGADEEGASDSDEGNDEEASDDGEAEQKDAEDDSGDDSPGEPPRSPLGAGVDFGLLSRTLSGADDSFGYFRTQEHSGTMPALSFYGSVYPVAFFTGGFFSNIGLIVGFETTFGGSANLGTAAASSVSTTSTQFNVGGRLRFPFGEQELGLSGAYMNHSFTFGFDPATQVRIIPDHDYDIVRLGADLQLKLGSFGIGLEGAYRTVLSAGTEPGQIGNANPTCAQVVNGACSYYLLLGFENLAAGGLDLGLDVKYWILDFLAIKAGVDYRHYYFDFRFDRIRQDELGAMTPPLLLKPVGGATDDYIVGSAGVEFQMQ